MATLCLKLELDFISDGMDLDIHHRKWLYGNFIRDILLKSQGSSKGMIWMSYSDRDRIDRIEDSLDLDVDRSCQI